MCLGCGDSETKPPVETEPEPPPELCMRVEGLDNLPLPESYEYDYTCSGEVPPSGDALPLSPVADDCSSGIWPDLDDTTMVCPTISDAMRDDPTSGLSLPSADSRALPVDIPLSESGTFLPPSAQGPWPETLRVVSWNMEYSASIDEQIDTLTSHQDLRDADVYLLSEVDRCSTRNGTRRAARELAEALGGMYVYGIEFVELNIDRTIGGDTGQAIVSRRPMSGAALSCHSSHFDWFASSDEPRLGQRVVLHADIPAGDKSVRVFSIHLESNDIAGDKRSVQSKEVLDRSQALACDRPQILGGDFNAPYCGAPELQVLRDAGFVDAVGLAGDLDPTHSNGLRLDYVWTRGFRVDGGGVIRGLNASDHDVVWVDLTLE